MIKELLISIKPEHLENILNGEKTLELRKTVPKHYKGWVNIYCTKSKVLEESFLGYRVLPINAYYRYGIGRSLSGSVVARFWFDEYDTYSYGNVAYPEFYEDYDGNIIDTTKDTKGYYILNEDLKKLCLSYEEFEEYGKGKDLYAWHIKKLEIFDTPLGLSDFYSGYDYMDNGITDELKFTPIPLTKAPQSYQFVYTKELKE